MVQYFYISAQEEDDAGTAGVLSEETTLVVCSGPGHWAWRSRGLGAWRSRGLDRGLGASAWGLLAVAVKVKPAIVLQVLVASDCGHHCYLASKSAYGIVVT